LEFEVWLNEFYRILTFGIDFMDGDLDPHSSVSQATDPNLPYKLNPNTTLT
jgi:hypothetical protein